MFSLSFNLSKTTREPPPPPVCQSDPVEVDYSKYLAGVDIERSRAANIEHYKQLHIADLASVAGRWDRCDSLQLCRLAQSESAEYC